jgi:hypothetical protein
MAGIFFLPCMPEKDSGLTRFFCAAPVLVLDACLTESVQIWTKRVAPLLRDW